MCVAEYHFNTLTFPGPSYTQRVELEGQSPKLVWQGSIGMHTRPSPLYPFAHVQTCWFGPVCAHAALAWHTLLEQGFIAALR